MIMTLVKSLLKLVDEKSNNPSVAVKYTKEDAMKDLFIEDNQFDEILQILEHANFNLKRNT